ncbi:quinol:cytochrome c oxidoreductase membrane protein [Archangium gephyra]|uniref:ABC-type Fe3+ transport system protein n=1 Tax=Archangium gephyra TaxID=48 RepID=A0AAC8Q0J6_9BACT|nr:DUF3341 domain-containing protein [Archangium gephyra]AKI98764.1 ABC-type Fe3+ transport system protein [Archangium gephyra]REG30684.1 quinol:cytochrome c oxidoreductase membrane protein [Archangium gephyra]
MRYWVVGEFGSGEEVKAALRRLGELGYAKETLDAFSPYPVEGIEEVLELKPSPLRAWAFVAGLTGAAGAYALQWWTNAVDYPLNVGNRPPHSGPAFVPITFETMVLFAALTLFFGLMWLFRFPRPHHPLFELESFRTASTGGFWVSVTTKRREEAEPVLGHLRELAARNTAVVEEKE